MFDSAQIFLSAFKLCKPFRWASETKDYVSKGFHNPLSLLSIAQNRMPTGIFVQSRTQVYWLKRVFHETFLVCCWLFHFLIKFIILYVFLGVRLMILSDQIPPMLIKTTFFLRQFSLGILNYFTDVKWFSRQSWMTNCTKDVIQIHFSSNGDETQRIVEAFADTILVLGGSSEWFAGLNLKDIFCTICPTTSRQTIPTSPSPHRPAEPAP